MSIKKRLITAIFTALLLMLGSSVTAYAAENSAETDMQAQESSSASSQTIVAGAATAEKKAAEDAAQENDNHGEDSDNTANAAANAGLVSLGVFKTTGYCPCYQCSEGWGRHTCTGAIARSNHTVAVDPRIIPYGSRLMINGTIYTAEDRGGGVRGNHIDIFYDTHSQTRQHGSRQAEVFLVV